jgi:membrane protease YdiL (CAAX protease family)
MTEREAAHPIEEIIRKNATTPVMFWCTVSAVVAAPLVEEFLFRVVLQGWLEKAFYKKYLREQAPDTEQVEFDQPFVPPDRTAPQIMWQPIIISSLVFAFLHVGHGPDPIPLFFLSLALGYLYYKTHRILPCIVVHMSLNSLSMVGLWAKLNDGTGV